MKIRVPHPLVLLTCCIFIAALLTYLIPAGEFTRQTDASTHREVVVAGTFKQVASSPVSPWQALIALPKGMIEAADVIFLVLLSGAAFMLVDKTGALRWAATALVTRLQNRKIWVIPVVSAFATVGGMLINMQEEFIALVPVFLLLVRRMGYDSLTAVAMSLGAAAVGAAFSPFNPFQVIIAQKLAKVPILTGMEFRLIFLAVAYIIWVAMTMRYAKKHTETPQIEEHFSSIKAGRSALIVALVLLTFGVYVYGIKAYEWNFNELSALFFLMGILAGWIGGLKMSEISDGFVQGLSEMAYAGILIGFARAIFVVMNEGHIIDSIVNGLFTPISSLPSSFAVMGMMAVQSALHFAVPSVSGQAVLTMPILAPLSDLLGLSRQITVLAYQYGAGLAELVVPTNGALMAMLAAANVPFDKWMRFVFPVWGILLALGLGAIFTAMALGI